jgi:hypothetical protein
MQAIKNWGNKFAKLPIDKQVILVCGIACAAGYLINSIKR